MSVAIVVNAYNRPAALARLLASLQQAAYPADVPVPLIISIDHGGAAAVRTLAHHFMWPHGPLEVIVQEQHLGLVQHFFACGDLTQRYDAIVYLEDDLTVSPVFLAYATQALSFYQHDQRVAGLSLFGLWFNGYTQQPFVPLADGSDAFFVQVPYTLGLAFTRAHWTRFKAWLSSSTAVPTAPLHEAWLHFDSNDWFPPLTRFTVATNRYFVFPRVSHVTGWGDVGTHFEQATRFLQVPLQRDKQHYTFKQLDEAVAVYDSFFELQPDRLNRLTDRWRGYNYTLDLYGSKSQANLRALRAEYTFTSRPCRNPSASFGKTRWPIEMNVVDQVPGAEIHFCRTADIRWDRLSRLRLWHSNYEYFARGRAPRLTTILKLALVKALHRFRPR
ncbi:hypothetical protein TFLX_02811 [Thermoflexales bacterium]|nr:hypothetical protein TFLX_02811 [Thermoflexales bacterium]